MTAKQQILCCCNWVLFSLAHLMNSSFPTPPPMCVLHVQVGRTLSNVPLPHCVPFWELGPGTGAPVHQKHADTKGGLGGCLPDPGRPFQGRAHIQTRFSLLWGTLLSAKGMFPGHGELSGPAAQRGHESREREREIGVIFFIGLTVRDVLHSLLP